MSNSVKGESGEGFTAFVGRVSGSAVSWVFLLLFRVAKRLVTFGVFHYRATCELDRWKLKCRTP